MAKRGLGRGLDVLITSASQKEGQRLEDVPVKDIRPSRRQPRKRFDSETIKDMAQSIKAFGVLQPVILRPRGTEYELVAGERRWLAAKEAGLEKIPAIIRESTETDALEIALIENLHRDDLNGIEEAHAYVQLLDDFGITHEELSRRVGKSRSAITNALRLLKLPADVQKQVMEGRLSTGHARALLALENADDQKELANRAIEKGLTVRQLEELVRRKASSRASTRRVRELPQEVSDSLKRLEEMLETRVRGMLGRRKGRITIEFKGIEEFSRIVSLIEAGAERSREPGNHWGS